MAESNYWAARATRRGVVRGGAVGAAGLATAAFIGCGDDDDKGKKATATTAKTGAAGTPKRGGTFVQTQTSSVQDVWDPHVSVSTASQMWALIGNLLIAPSIDGTKLEGQLVEKWEMPAADGTEFVFTVRQGPKWHNRPPSNGRKVTADDIAYTLNRIAGKTGVKSQRAATLAGMDSATAVDEKTVKIKMASVNSGFLNGVSEWRNMGVPKDYAETTDWKDPAKLIGSGPFVCEKWDDLKEAMHSRNPDYWEAPMPYTDFNKTVWLPDALSLQSSFAKGDVHLMLEPTPTQLKSLEAQTKDFRVEKWVSGTWYHNRFNLQKQPFQDPRVRRAMQLVIDWPKLHDPIFGKGDWFYTAAVPTVFPEGVPSADMAKLPGFNPATKEQDIKDARALMSAAGQADPNFAFKILFPYQNVVWYDLSIRVAEQWKAIWPNMKPEIENAADLTTFLTRSAKSEFDMTTYRFAVAPDAVTEAQVGYHSKGARNYGKFADPRIDAALDKAVSQIKFEERKATLIEMQKLLHSELMPTIPLDIYNYPVAFRSNVKGMEGFGGKLAANSDDTRKNMKRAWFA